MRNIKNRKVITDNKLILIVRDEDTKQIFRKGKRVGKDCPISPEERKAYVKVGAVHAIKMIRDNHKISLTEAFQLLKLARGDQDVT